MAGFIGSPAMNFFETRIVEEHGSLFTQGEKLKLAIPENLQNRYRKTNDHRVIWGIRPEHLYEKGIKGTFPGGELMRATVDVIEPVGSVVILLCSCVSTQLTACVDPQTRVRPHDEIEFIVDMNQMHLFDESTGEVF